MIRINLNRSHFQYDDAYHIITECFKANSSGMTTWAHIKVGTDRYRPAYYRLSKSIPVVYEEEN